ncbi:hypothetical protein LJK88_36950 [Paenibacillus sp. P26]|nr:hypothetical protein LJK88_36950 [Paenibacillus sp. P26]
MLLSITIGVVCAALYMFFSANSVKEVAGISQSMLRQTSYVANIVNQQVYEIGNHLLNNPDIVTGMFNPEIDHLQEYRVVRALTDVQAGYPFLNFIGIYNGYTERYINNKGVSRQAEAELLDQTSKSSETAYSGLYPRTFKDPVTGAGERVFTFVLKPGFNSYLPKKGQSSSISTKVTSKSLFSKCEAIVPTLLSLPTMSAPSLCKATANLRS